MDKDKKSSHVTATSANTKMMINLLLLLLYMPLVNTDYYSSIKHTFSFSIGQKLFCCKERRVKGKMKLSAFVFMLMAFGMFIGKSNASITTFRDCYSKCFVFCLIEPSQNLCTCTSRCLKECIFNTDPGNSSSIVATSNNDVADSKNLNFCKLGCAFSTCSTLSTKHQPNVGKMDDCVGSCSRMCTKNYSSP